LIRQKHEDLSLSFGSDTHVLCNYPKNALQAISTALTQAAVYDPSALFSMSDTDFKDIIKQKGLQRIAADLALLKKTMNRPKQNLHPSESLELSESSNEIESPKKRRKLIKSEMQTGWNIKMLDTFASTWREHLKTTTFCKPLSILPLQI
jgi:hypothetical protein